jgi:hypothetical protein
MFTVYMHVNKTNNKKYIGITSQKPEDRWGPGGSHYSSQYFARAIKKYGWDGFDHFILCEDLEEDEAKEMEITLIKEYNTFDRTCGYNCTLGGDGIRLYMTEEERKIAAKESGARSRSKVKADPEKYQQRLEQMREFKKQYKEDPEMHEKILEANRRCHREQRSTPEGKAKDHAASAKVRADAKQIRNELRDLYNQHPDLFSDEDFKIVFDRRQTPNKSWVFTYNSKTALSNILTKIKEKIKVQYETNT